MTPNLEVFQVLWYHICPNFGPFEYIPPMFSMAAHRTRARPLIEAPIHLFGRESKTTKAPQQRLSWLEHCRSVVPQSHRDTVEKVPVSVCVFVLLHLWVRLPRFENGQVRVE